MLGVIYAFVFIALSLVSCVVFMIVPKLRRYALHALAAPVTFGFCSIVGTGLIVYAFPNSWLTTTPAVGFQTALHLVLIYFFPGIVGASLAVWFVSWAKRKLLS